MSNYHPGVTGFEREISGPDDEWRMDRYCPACGQDTRFDMASYGSSFWGTCVTCDFYVEGDLTEWDGD